MTSLIHRVSVPFLFALALAFPWDLYQRLPFAGLTLVKLCGLALAGAALVLVATRPAVRRIRTGFEAPIALFVIAAVQSAFHSMHSAASLTHLIMLGTYVALFFATATFVSTPSAAIRLLRCYATSSVIVATMGMLCLGGMFWPTAWRTIYGPWDTRLIEVWRDGALMRMAAASPDVNQGALFMGMGAAILLFARPGRSRAANVLAGVCLVTVFSGTIVTQSRSALAALAVLGAVRLFGVSRRRISPRAASLLLGGVSFAAGALAFTAMPSLLSRDDHSIQSRAAPFRAAAELLPAHAWLGVGLGASDTALDRGPHTQEIDGATLHSVPFKVLLETGVLGFIALIWFFVQFAQTLYRRRTVSPDARELAACAAAAMFVALVMALVQPLQWMSVYPFLAGVAAGPFARRAPEMRPPASDLGFRPAIAGAAMLVALVTVWNIRAYQQRVEDGVAFSDALAEAAQLERNGHLLQALGAYTRAVPLAETFARDRDPDAFAAYTDTAERLVDFEKVYDAMGISMERPDTRAVLHFARGRIQFELRNTAAARTLLHKAVEFESSFAECYATLGDCEWARGDFLAAVNAYDHARQRERDPANRRHRWRMDPWDARIDLLEGPSSTAPLQLERMRLLRIRGRWPEVVFIAQSFAQTTEAPADAWLYLAIEAERQGDAANARGFYRRALAVDPIHLDTLRRIVLELERFH